MAFNLATARPAEEVEQPPAPAAAPQAAPQFNAETAKPASYLGDYVKGIKDAATVPGGGPTGIDLIDAAAGVADFGASAVTDAVMAVPRIASHVFAKARGDTTPYSERAEGMTRKPNTPVGQAIQGTLGAVMRPIGDAASAAGLSPDTVALGGDVLGTAADVVGLGWAARSAKAGAQGARAARGVATDIPNPTPGGAPLRPFGPAVEKARKLDYRVLPSQVAGAAQAAAPAGEFGFGHRVPGTFREGFTANDLGPMAVIDNQKRTNVFAAKELGISEITPQGLALAKNPHNAVFNEVARSIPQITPDEPLTAAMNALGEARRTNPLLRNSNDVELLRERLLAAGPVPTQKVLDAIREYRRDANTLYKKMGDPEAEQQAAAYRQAADALEAAIERQAGVLDPSLVPRLKDARIALAKIHNVEDALDGNNVDATRLARIGKKFPLSGYLADIAEIATEFPDTMKSATGVSLPAQSQIGSIWSPHLFARRALGKEQGPTLLRDRFQRKFGAADPAYDPRPAPTPVEGSPFAEYAPPAGDVPGGADVMPPAPGGGPGLTATDLAADFDTLPPAEAFPGDLTAETPPMGGSLPAGALDDILTELGLEPPLPARTTDTVDFAPDPDLSAQLVGDDPLGQRVPAAPGGDAVNLTDDLLPPMSDQELLDLQLQTALPPGAEPPAMPPRRPPPPDEDLGAAMVEPERPPPQGPAPADAVPVPDGIDEILALLDESPPRAEAPPLGDTGPDYVPPPNAIVLKDKGRSIVLEPTGDRLAIRHTSVDPEARGKGLGQQNIVDAVYRAIKLRKPLDSDVSFTRDAWRAWKAALDKGLVAADDIPYDAIEAAMESGGGVARNPTGESWIKDIRIGPAG